MLNRRLTGALAWGGLVLILAVPSAEIISARVEPLTAKVSTVTDPIQTASIAVATDTVKAAAPIKKIPALAAASVAPKPVAPVTGVVLPKAAVATVVPKAVVPESSATATVALPEVDATGVAVKSAVVPTETVKLKPSLAENVPVEVKPAAVETAKLVAPVPMPASMRPKPVDPTEMPLVIDETTVASRTLAVPVEQPKVVTEEELQEWDSGSLADYLERRGLVSDASFYTDPANSSATYTRDDGLVPLTDVTNSDDAWDNRQDGDSVLLWGN